MRASCLVVALAALVSSSGPVAAAEMDAVCPTSIPASAFKGTDAPDGGVASTPNPLKLSAAGMMAGAPDSMLYLVPNASTRTTQTFEFEPGDRQRWLWCAYGPAQLSKRMADTATNCVVTTREARPGSAMTAKVRCQATSHASKR
jgi:hypothetical protein